MDTLQPSFAALTTFETSAWPGSKTIRRRRRRKGRRLTPDLAEFERRAVQRDYRPLTAYVQLRRLRSVADQAPRQEGRRMSVIELARHPVLFARACCDATRRDGRGDGELKTATILGHCVAARSFMRLMEDQIGESYDALVERFDAAVHEHCDPLGLMLRLKVGDRQPREKYTPSRSEIVALLREASTHQGPFQAARDVAFLVLLASIGRRVFSITELDGGNFYFLDGYLYVRVREKGKAEPHQVLITPEVRLALERYIRAYNLYAATRGSADRVGFSVPGPFWRSALARPFTTDAATMMVRRSSRRACSCEFGPHAIRRFVTQENLERLPRSIVLEALGWESLQTLDEHYAAPPAKFLSPPPSNVPLSPDKGAEDAAARTEAL